MATQGQVNVQIDGDRVSVEGRVYEGSHILVLGASGAQGTIGFSPQKAESEWEELTGSVKLSMTFDGFPSVEVDEDMVKTYLSSSQSADFTTPIVSQYNELEDGYIITGDRVLIKFEVDESERKVVLRVPNVGTFRVPVLTVSCDGRVNVNVIVRPFIMGIIAIEEAGQVKIQISSDGIEVMTRVSEVKTQVLHNRTAMQRAPESA